MRTLFVAIVALVGVSTSAMACGCNYPETVSEHISGTSVIGHIMVLEARVLHKSELADLDADFIESVAKGTLLVQKAVKGVKTGDTITAYFDVSGTSCDFPPRVGEGSVLFVNRYKDAYWVFLCAQDAFWMDDRHDKYIDEFERMTGEDWNRWRYNRR